MIENVMYGVLIVLVIVLLWFVWAYYIYRYSDDRIKSKILNAYSMRSDSLSPSEKTEYVANVDTYTISPTQITATVSFQLLPGATSPKNPQRPPLNVTYKVIDETSADASNCIRAIDMDCILL